MTDAILNVIKDKLCSNKVNNKIKVNKKRNNISHKKTKLTESQPIYQCKPQTTSFFK